MLILKIIVSIWIIFNVLGHMLPIFLHGKALGKGEHWSLKTVEAIEEIQFFLFIWPVYLLVILVAAPFAPFIGIYYGIFYFGKWVGFMSVRNIGKK